MTIVYPDFPKTGEITPHGMYHVFKGDIPDMELHAYDDSIIFHLMGGRSIPDKVMQPERIEVKNIKGLIAPWQIVDQKGATEDGVTFIDAMNDPIKVELDLVAKGKTPQRTRKVVSDFYASLDTKKTSDLVWYTQQLGRWWAPIRWFSPPLDNLGSIHQNKQDINVEVRADNGFWRTYDEVHDFGFDYTDMTDAFDTDYSSSHDLGPNWPQHYVGGTTGYCSTNPTGEARWYNAGNAQREVINGPYKDFETETDDQVVQMELGSFPTFTFASQTYDDVWARMSRDGSGNWAGDGIRLRVGTSSIYGWIQLSYFVDFVETVFRARILIVPPLPGEKFTLIAGTEGQHRQFTVLRNGLKVMDMVEQGFGSLLGAPYRGVGFGMLQGNGFVPPLPAWIRKISAGDNSTVSQEGFLQRVNPGDQPMYDRYTFFGPGTVSIANGPGSEDMVSFGPLLPKVVQIRTDPRKRGITDLTSTPPTPQELDHFQQAIKDFISFATGNNVPPLLQQIESFFGIQPPQGNMYTLLKGRFRNNQIPARSPGNPMQPYYVKVAIDDGNASSKLIAAGTPLRRYPI